jgi:hypothetical protein
MGLTDHYFEKYWVGFQDNFADQYVDGPEPNPAHQVDWQLGQELEGKWTDDEYYYGRISKIFKNGKFKFNYDDGTTPRNLFSHEIRHRTPIVKFGLPDIPGILGFVILCTGLIL